MLVLRRKTHEAIVLNGVITIRVLGVEGDRVKLGIDAPPDVIVVRDELFGLAGDGRHGIIAGEISTPSHVTVPVVRTD